MSYETKNIRNICLLGHGNSGKTSLAEGMLFATGAIDRMGKVSDGNTVCDYDAEEIKRQITISTAVAPVNFGGCKINVLDCPGYFDFVGEALAAIRKGRHLRRRREKLEVPQRGKRSRYVLHLQDRRRTRRFL